LGVSSIAPERRYPGTTCFVASPAVIYPSNQAVLPLRR
jgi:hypothetical protein